MKKSVTAMCAVVLLLSATVATQVLAQGDSEVQTGLSMSPVPLNTRGLNLALVGRGSYLVNGPGNCSSCHTVGARFLPGGDPFLGQPKMENTVNFLGGNRTFGPTIVSRNLTPDARGLPGGLTLDQFIFTMRSGTDLKNLTPISPGPVLDLLQIMPWPQYQNLTVNDLRAMYEYLKAIACVPGGPGLSATRCTP
jgi:hypothetical protein